MNLIQALSSGNSHKRKNDNYWATTFASFTKEEILDNNWETPEEAVDPKKVLIEYLIEKTRQADWHAVSDAANDLRVLEATLNKAP